MTTPVIPPELGQKVTTRVISWEQMVIGMWGQEWAKPDIAYEMSNGAKKESTDQWQTGIYRRT